MNTIIKTIAPGKIIVSGEHAVVYGKPALVLAIDRYAKTTITPALSNSVSIQFQSGKIPKWARTYSFEEMREVYNQILKDFSLFQNGAIQVEDVLKNKFDLIPFAIFSIISALNLQPNTGFNVEIHVDIPVGCGMGSSAAIALSLLKATANHLGCSLENDRYFDHAMTCEKLCHGTPSGVDPFACLHGGFIEYQKGCFNRLQVPNLDLHLVLTGVPSSTTGECVMQVKKQFEASSIWSEFEDLSQEIKNQFINHDQIEIVKLVRANHRLLQEIQVVPERVGNFIQEVESRNGAAKITGAGAIRGNSGGAVLVFCKEPIHDLCQLYGYEVFKVNGDPNGLRKC